MGYFERKRKEEAAKALRKKIRTVFTVAAILAAAGCIAFFGYRYRERIYYTLTGHHTAAYEELVNGTDTVSVSFIDIGMGDAALIRAGSSTVLIDTGDIDSAGILTGYLDAQQVTSVDYLIITHPHGDHYGSADDVLKNYQVGCVLATYVPEAIREESAGWDYVLRVAQKQGVEVRTAEVGEILALDKGEIRILFAGSDDCEDVNACSIVCRYVYGGRAFLFTGDAEMRTEKRILESGADVRADVLKAGHHGSWYSSCREFLAKVKPDYVIASCSEGNEHGFPKEIFAERVRDAGAELLVTYQTGTIVFVTDGEQLMRVS